MTTHPQLIAETHKYQLADIGFHSKDAMAKYVQALLRTAPVDTKLNLNYQDIISALFERHPGADRKRGCGISYFYVTHPFNNEQKQFMLMRHDGTCDDFSYKTCITGKAASLETDALKALRLAIRDQIEDFRRSLHIHHVTPFRDLVRQFLGQEGITEADIETFDAHFAGGVRMADVALMNRWQEYHSHNAQYEALTEANHVERHQHKK